MTKTETICVYCGSSNQVDEAYKDAARKIGTWIGESGKSLVYGGGNVGLMGITAEAALNAGAKVTGIITEHIRKREVEHKGLDELHIVETMHERKRMMVDRSDALIILPGGLGTMDEMFEFLTWRQLNLHDEPLIVVNVNGYWDPLKALLENIAKEGFMREYDLKLCTFVDKPEDVAEALEREPEPSIDPDSKWI